jgi:hypothetical protein
MTKEKSANDVIGLEEKYRAGPLKIIFRKDVATLSSSFNVY